VTKLPEIHTDADLTAAVDTARRVPAHRTQVFRAATAFGRAHTLPDGWPLLAAGTRNWDPTLHPRGRDGRFIAVGALLNLFDGPGYRTPSARGEAVGLSGTQGSERITVRITYAGRGSRLRVGDEVEYEPGNIATAPRARARLTNPTVGQLTTAEQDMLRRPRGARGPNPAAIEQADALANDTTQVRQRADLDASREAAEAQMTTAQRRELAKSRSTERGDRLADRLDRTSGATFPAFGLTPPTADPRTDEGAASWSNWLRDQMDLDEESGAYAFVDQSGFRRILDEVAESLDTPNGGPGVDYALSYIDDQFSNVATNTTTRLDATEERNAEVLGDMLRDAANAASPAGEGQGDLFGDETPADGDGAVDASEIEAPEAGPSAVDTAVLAEPTDLDTRGAALGWGPRGDLTPEQAESILESGEAAAARGLDTDMLGQVWVQGRFTAPTGATLSPEDVEDLARHDVEYTDLSRAKWSDAQVGSREWRGSTRPTLGLSDGQTYVQTLSGDWVDVRDNRTAPVTEAAAMTARLEAAQPAPEAPEAAPEAPEAAPEAPVTADPNRLDELQGGPAAASVPTSPALRATLAGTSDIVGRNPVESMRNALDSYRPQPQAPIPTSRPVAGALPATIGSETPWGVVISEGPLVGRFRTLWVESPEGEHLLITRGTPKQTPGVVDPRMWQARQEAMREFAANGNYARAAELGRARYTVEYLLPERDEPPGLADEPEPDAPDTSGEPEPVPLDELDEEGLAEADGGPDVSADTNPVPEDETPNPVPERDAALAERIRGIARSADNKGLGGDDLNAELEEILQLTDPADAHARMNRLMARVKLGGKQRARYRAWLDSYLGTSGDEPEKVINRLSDDNPLKARLTERTKAPAAEAAPDPAPVAEAEVPEPAPEPEPIPEATPVDVTPEPEAERAPTPVAEPTPEPEATAPAAAPQDDLAELIPKLYQPGAHKRLTDDELRRALTLTSLDVRRRVLEREAERRGLGATAELSPQEARARITQARDMYGSNSPAYIEAIRRWAGIAAAAPVVDVEPEMSQGTAAGLAAMRANRGTGGTTGV